MTITLIEVNVLGMGPSSTMSPTAPDEALVATLRAAGCVFAEDEARLLHDAAYDDTELRRMVADRVAGTPLEQVVGYADFCGLRVAVAPGVFVPRRRTTALVRAAADGLRGDDAVVDLCCGTGAVAMAVRAAVPAVEVYAADLDPAAVSCARRNLPPERVFEGDLYDALPDALRGSVARVVANAPYVPSAAIALMPPEARDHEHRIALDGGDDGLDVQRGVVAGAREWLAPGGRLLIETSRRQAPGTADLMRTVGLVADVMTDEEVDGTVVTGRLG
jgi:release factor glutamine methyltransferase